MALSKTIQFKPSGFVYDITVSSAYHRVSTLSGDKYGINFKIDVFQTKEAKEPLDKKQYSFAPKMDGDNFIKQAYDHLKTLPEFAGAIDC